MGAISPAPALNDSLNQEIFNKIIIPTINGMKSDGIVYEGILYAGIMLTKDGPKVIEFNCRFGDPETQVVLPRLETDLVEIVKNTVDKKLNGMKIDLSDNTAITVVLASQGYPGDFKKGNELPLLYKYDQETNISIFHSGTSENNEKKLVSNGGRVLSVTTIGQNVKECRDKAYKTIEDINWEKGFYRKDIGKL